MAKKAQPSLFEEYQEENLETISPSTSSLRISGLSVEELSPAQRRFNSLVKQIEKLRVNIERENFRLSHIRAFWQSHGLPALVKVGHAQIKLARAIDSAVAAMKFSPRQKEQIGQSIRSLLDDAARFCELSDDDLAVYEHWVGMGFEEAQRASQAAEMDYFIDMMRDLTGIELEKPEIGEDISFSFEDFLKKTYQQVNAENDAKPKNQKRKTKKQLEKEALEQAAQELEKKSVRSVYIGLAKVLHPDMEADPDRRAEKKDMMQKLTTAYEKNDLHTLLTMEMEWANQQTSQLGSLSEDKLAVYIQVLKDQVKELQCERSGLWMQNALPGMDTGLLGKTLERAKRLIMEDARQYESMGQAIIMDLQQIERGISKQDLLLLLRERMPPF
jgi:hypothetical protein